ncbi:MAG: ABC transporter substrate-binding protein [Chloroflexi bacterium]|nr:ABC transporter substrate-binding protein [Chloroflexota bacterium]
MKHLDKLGVLILVVLLLAIPMLAACGDDDKDKTPTKTTPAATTPTPSPKPSPEPPVKITIGLFTDVTGMAAAALVPVDAALLDIVKYYEDNNLIPGAEFEVIKYDGQYDPSKDIAGYEWLKERGADFFVSGVPSFGASVKPRVDADKMVLFQLEAADEYYTPPGWVFCETLSADQFGYTLLKWIAENDPNFPKGRPAKIGAVGQADPYVATLQAGLEAYAKAHPDQYQWVKGIQTGWDVVTFPAEVDILKGCDYVMPPSTAFWIPQFMKEMRAAGSKATFLSTDAQIAYLGMIRDMAGWDVFDGTILALPYSWWTEDYELAKLANKLVAENHSAEEAATFKDSGGAYRGGFTQWYGSFAIVAETIKAVGAKNFNSQALYDHCVKFKGSFDGNVWSFSETKRTPWEGVGIFRADAAKKDLVRVSDGWYPVEIEP